MELGNIKESIWDAAELAIAEQIILLVGIERAGDDLLQNRLAMSFREELNDTSAIIVSEKVRYVMVGSY